jgi:hypothetical protein
MSRITGYKTCPFDLCQTPYESLIQCLRDNFEHFFDNLHLVDGVIADGLRTKTTPYSKLIKYTKLLWYDI